MLHRFFCHKTMEGKMKQIHVPIHNDINNCVYTTQERADQGTTKSRSEAYEHTQIVCEDCGFTCNDADGPL